MSPIFPFGVTLTLRQQTVSGQDQYGNDVYENVDTPVDGCVVIPRNSSELVQGQDTVIVGLTAYFPAGVTVTPTDKVLVDSVVYEVDGEPGYYQSPLTGSYGPTQVALTRYTG